MSQPIAAQNSKRTIALIALLCGALNVPIQYGLGALSGRESSYWFYLVGTPIVYVLFALIGAFCASGGLGRFEARSSGGRLGTLSGVSGAILATLTLIVFTLIAIYTPGPSAHGVRFPDNPNGFVLLFYIIILGPSFLVGNLLGLGLATLGGSLGGVLRGLVSGAK